ncbi:MAG: hypothetical protein R3F56_02895 [Planctomycetota bacterium]
MRNLLFVLLAGLSAALVTWRQHGVDRLRAELADQDPLVRRGAALALMRRGAAAAPAVPELAALVADDAVAAVAMSALAAIGQAAEPAVPAVAARAMGGDFLLRARAVFTLCRIAPEHPQTASAVAAARATPLLSTLAVPAR